MAQHFGHTGAVYGSLPCYTIQGKPLVFQTNQDADYFVKAPGSRAPWSFHNMLPFDRNWGRSNVLPLNYQPNGAMNFADDPYIPAIPLATYRGTDYRQLSYSAVDDLPIRPYRQLY